MEDNRKLKHELPELSKEEKELIVNEYLKNYYRNDQKDQDIVVSDITYKTLKRSEVTTFYDAKGNTLFDVENQTLAEEYALMGNNQNLRAEETPALIDEEAPEKKEVIVKQHLEVVQETVEDIKEQAKKKLEEELKKAEDTTFAELVIQQLLNRCEEDSGLAQDVMQEHKTWSKCVDYIHNEAKKQMHKMQAVIRDVVVYEWAEDYYHKDDKAEEEAKAKEEAERIKRQKEIEKKAERTKKSVTKDTNRKSLKEEPIKKVETAKKNTKDIEGQMDLFSMMGM